MPNRVSVFSYTLRFPTLPLLPFFLALSLARHAVADFHTHVTFSSVLGCGYSVAGMMAGLPPSTALVGGGLCGLSGMLPDVDSDSGIPRRETMGFAAAIVPMLLVDRFRQFDLTHDQMVLLAAGLYFAIRFVASRLIGKWSVHRGMWHSIPAVLIFAGVAFLIAGPANDLTVRYFKAFAVALGALSHLILDEIYSVDTRGVVPKFKKSFGTAVKMWGKNSWANFSTYAKLAVVVMAIAAEPSVLARIAEQHPELADRIEGYSNRWRGENSSDEPLPTAPASDPPWPGTSQAPSPAQPYAAQPGNVTPSANQPAAPISAPGYQQPNTRQPNTRQPYTQQPYTQQPFTQQPAAQQPAAPQAWPTQNWPQQQNWPQPQQQQLQPLPRQQLPSAVPSNVNQSPFPSQAHNSPPSIRRQ